VVEQGYLTLNPLRYSDALLSSALLLLFVLVGGLGLPGGAVRVDPTRTPVGFGRHWYRRLVRLPM